VFVKYQAQGGVLTPTPLAYALACIRLLSKCSQKNDRFAITFAV